MIHYNILSSRYSLILASLACLRTFNLSHTTCHALVNPKPKTYNYSAFGSNMASSTMINLRNISPLASTAAILPKHALRFNIPGLIGVEPSSAAVEPTNTNNNRNSDTPLVEDGEEVVHGVLYKLTEGDFATVCRTEGVPFAYCLYRCRVIPYVGDEQTAGKDAMYDALSISEERNQTKSTPGNEYSERLSRNDWGVPAFTLRAARKGWRQGDDIPPSKSYLNVLIRGAKEFAMDESYVQKLKRLPVGKTWIGDGLAEELLRRAEQW